MTRIRMNWATLGRSVRMELLEDQAPLLCEAFKSSLPLKSVCWHAVVSGENVGFQMPFVWTRVENPAERVLGGVFTYANAQLCIIPYGRTTEPGRVNTFARIVEEDLGKLAEVGRIVAAEFTSGSRRPILVDVAIDVKA